MQYRGEGKTDMVMSIIERSDLVEKIDLLKKYLEMASHNLLCYSANYGMTEPKPTWDREWQEAKEEVDLLKEMIQKAENENTATSIQQLYISKETVLKVIDSFNKALQKASGMTEEEWTIESELINKYLDNAGKPFAEFTYDELEDFHAYLASNCQSADMQHEQIQQE